MFVDTSAIIAILNDEPEREQLIASIEHSLHRMTSALVILEATMRLSTMLNIEPIEVEKIVIDLITDFRIDTVAIDQTTASLAIDAFARFGKGRGHPAQLNIADCMSYACAKQNQVNLLFKGNDFAQTDMA
jgi:ribonuclease VapC